MLDVIFPELAADSIAIVRVADLEDAERKNLAVYFDEHVYPVLTPLAVDPGHPFPMISNLSLNIAVSVIDEASGEERSARVKVPNSLPRFLPAGTDRWCLLEDLIMANLGQLFPGMTIGRADLFRVTRNADLMLEEDEADDLLVALEVELRRRRFGEVLRVELQSGMSQDFLDLLVGQLELDPSSVYVTDAPLGLHDLWSLYSMERPDLRGEGWSPLTPARLLQGDHVGDIFAAIREGDILLHHPYESFGDSVEVFIAQAAEDPQVAGIKMTLYRTSGDSPVVKSLIRAAENGKQVVALVELKARFDEAANIEWAKALEDAGAHVVYGVVGLKTHSKTTLIVRNEGSVTARYVHVATGNYNDKTARIYEDFGLLTCDPDIAHDVGELFNFLTGFARVGRVPLDHRQPDPDAAAGPRAHRDPARPRPARVDRHEGQRPDGPRDHRRALRGERRRRGHPPRGAHAVLPAPRGRGPVGEDHGALARWRVPRAQPRVHLRTPRRDRTSPSTSARRT